MGRVTTPVDPKAKVGADRRAKAKAAAPRTVALPVDPKPKGRVTPPVDPKASRRG